MKVDSANAEPDARQNQTSKGAKCPVHGVKVDGAELVESGHVGGTMVKVDKSVGRHPLPA